MIRLENTSSRLITLRYKDKKGLLVKLELVPTIVSEELDITVKELAKKSPVIKGFFTDGIIKEYVSLDDDDDFEEDELDLSEEEKVRNALIEKALGLGINNARAMKNETIEAKIKEIEDNK